MRRTEPRSACCFVSYENFDALQKIESTRLAADVSSKAFTRQLRQCSRKEVNFGPMPFAARWKLRPFAKLRRMPPSSKRGSFSPNVLGRLQQRKLSRIGVQLTTAFTMRSLRRLSNRFSSNLLARPKKVQRNQRGTVQAATSW